MAWPDFTFRNLDLERIRSKISDDVLLGVCYILLMSRDNLLIWQRTVMAYNLHPNI